MSRHKSTRIKAVVSYNGKNFRGFQKQNSTPQTISGAIEKALNSLGIEASIVGSGRTDAGVHASGQVIHCDIPSYWEDLHKLKEHLNTKLNGIQFKYICKKDKDFHARFSAKRRIYRYVFKTTRPSVFEEDTVAYISIEDFMLLQKALECFVGEHDFSYFLKSGSETKSNTREIHKAFYTRRGAYHYIYFEADGFLRAQVRMMIDFAIRVSNKEFTPQQLNEQLSLEEVHSRRLAPAQGLYLSRVLY